MGDAMAEMNKPNLDEVTAQLHKEIDAVPVEDRPLLLRLVQSYREGTAENYERWFKKKVEAGIRAADEGRLINHEALMQKWQAKRAAEMD